MGYKQSMELLEEYGIETPVSVILRSREHFEIATKGKLSYPLVLKAIPKNAGHKSERHMVSANLHSLKEVRDAYETMVQDTAGIPLECFLLQEQVKGVELIVGAKRDEVFGQTVMFGMGGIYVELTADFSVRVCPITQEQAGDMIMETKAAAFFREEGFRGMKADKDAVAGLLANVCRMLLEGFIFSAE